MGKKSVLGRKTGGRAISVINRLKEPPYKEVLTVIDFTGK